MFSYLFRSSIISLNRFVYQSKFGMFAAHRIKKVRTFEIINDKKKCFKTKIMIIINKSFVLERSRIIFFFFCIINAIVHFRSSQPIFNMWFSDFPKKDKYVFWKFKQMTIFEVLVFHKDSSSNADSISSSERLGVASLLS